MRLFVFGALCGFAGCDGGEASGGGTDAAMGDAKVVAADSSASLDAAVHDARIDATASDAGTGALDPDARTDAAPNDAAMGMAGDDSGADAHIPGDCDEPVACPGAAPNKVTVCGRLYDVQTDTEIRAAVPQFASCGSGFEATDGPCNLAIRFYDAVAFAGDPVGSAPLAVQALQLDDCGRYVAENIDLPSSSSLGVAVEDGPAASDDHRLAIEAFAVSSGEVREGQRSYVVRRSTDLDWSADASLGASTFVDLGVLMSIFYHGTTPVTGVTVTSSGFVRASDDYYFTDTDAKVRSSVTAAGPTQANGTALLLDSSSPASHSGQGGEPSGCLWPSAFAASVPGVLWVLPHVAELAAGGVCP